MDKTEFSNLNLHTDLLLNLSSLGYDSMTPIQAQSLPYVLDGKDVIAQAKTGSGKTAAFGLGILNKLNTKIFRPQSLVLCPTRELADQVATELRKLARRLNNVKILTLCGGTPFGPQVGSLEHGAHIVVGTPGRIEEHLRKKNLDCSSLISFVLDEADRMLDMGFQESLDTIIEYLPKNRQTLLFSATFPEQIKSIANEALNKPVTIKVESDEEKPNIEQLFFVIRDNSQRLQTTLLLLHKYQPESTLVFCNTKRETEEIANFLSQKGFACLALHGDMEQKSRNQTLVRFSNKSTSVLVATDVAARGLDIDSLNLVINFQIARESEVHIHRIGRTGRAGNQGLACTLFEESERYKIDRLEDQLHTPITISETPDNTLLTRQAFSPNMNTIQIDGGKKNKIRPADILGALTGDKGIGAKNVGKISVFDYCSFVAIERENTKQALNKLSEGKIKGRTFRVRRIRG